MITLRTYEAHQVYTADAAHGVSSAQLTQARSQYTKIAAAVASRKQGFVGIPFDTTVADQVMDFVQHNRTRFDRVVILGIGGSMLGPQVIVDAFPSSLTVDCLDNVDPFVINNLAQKLDYPRTLFVVQTKSGGTPETISQYLFFKDQAQKNGATLQDNFVFVTDPDVGYLRQVATQHNVTSFAIPANVGGRFSVLTPVGLLIAGLMGLNVHDMLAGAAAVTRSEYLDKTSSQAFDAAAAVYALQHIGKNEIVIMPYSSRLATFSKWCIQLISESLGKAVDVDNKTVHAGVTPIPAVGATDQHSQLQLFAEGPNNKILMFIQVADYQADVPIPAGDVQGVDGFEYLTKTSFADLLTAELQGTRQALTEALRPSMTVGIERVDEANVGALFQFFELMTAYLGEMLHINTFDQPGVERSKILTKKNLLEN